MTCEAIKTKYGNATLNRDGYYKLNTGRNAGKLLHRVIFEDFYQCDLDEEFPDGVHIHHVDHNRTNNEIWNLEIISPSEHQRMHQTGKNNSMCKNTTTGIFRVYKQKAKSCKQGFTWKYQYYGKDGKRRKFESVDLLKLKQKVLAKGFEWEILDVNLVKSCCEEYGYDFEEVVK